MGGVLLLLQGTAALCWLMGRHGARGGLAALLVFLLAWAVEHTGVATGVLLTVSGLPAASQAEVPPWAFATCLKPICVKNCAARRDWSPPRRSC